MLSSPRLLNLFAFVKLARSPYVGLSVCMHAYNRVPEAQRDRLVALTGERNRFIGGSADTMYIPGRHRDTFMSILALFLQTDCFLEIAAPTALHLALPPDEEILFVDHVCAVVHFTTSFLWIKLTCVFSPPPSVVDMAAAFRHGVCARAVGSRSRSGFVPLVPLG